MKGILALIFIFFVQNVIFAAESDSTQKPKFEHHIGFELLGKQNIYSIYYELEVNLRIPKHNVGAGFGTNFYTMRYPNAKYWGKALYFYHSYGSRNQIKSSIGFDLSTNITNLTVDEETLETEGKRSNFIKRPSLSIGYLRKTKGQRLSVGFSALYVQAYYDLYNLPNLIEKQKRDFFSASVFIHYNLF